MCALPKVFRSFRSFVPMVGGGVGGDGGGKDEGRGGGLPVGEVRASGQGADFRKFL